MSVCSHSPSVETAPPPQCDVFGGGAFGGNEVSMRSGRQSSHDWISYPMRQETRELFPLPLSAR